VIGCKAPAFEERRTRFRELGFEREGEEILVIWEDFCEDFLVGGFGRNEFGLERGRSSLHMVKAMVIGTFFHSCSKSIMIPQQSIKPSTWRLIEMSPPSNSQCQIFMQSNQPPLTLTNATSSSQTPCPTHFTSRLVK
jgi:hypothetical protein